MSSADLDIRFADATFDVIYIDGNHTTEYVYQDAKLSLKKLVPGGYLIFDDVHDKGVVAGINLFLAGANKFVHKEIQINSGQAFIKKI
jgi:predicted O-methyltransferase YrrM